MAQQFQRHGSHNRRDGDSRCAALVFAPKQPASFFFARITSNPNGWPYWWAFIIGLLQAQWTFTGYDASASVSEETVNPGRRAPWGMVMSRSSFKRRRIPAAYRADSFNQRHLFGSERGRRERQSSPGCACNFRDRSGKPGGSYIFCARCDGNVVLRIGSRHLVLARNIRILAR